MLWKIGLLFCLKLVGNDLELMGVVLVAVCLVVMAHAASIMDQGERKRERERESMYTQLGKLQDGIEIKREKEREKSTQISLLYYSNGNSSILQQAKQCLFLL